MRAVMLEVPQALLDERRAKGADRWDEMWEGELHMVPPPSDRHQDVVEPETRRVELFANRDGRMVPVEPVVIGALGVRAETVDGTLRLTWEGGTADV